MLLHGVEKPNIRYRDSLAQDHAGEEEKYTLVLANPPFAQRQRAQRLERPTLWITRWIAEYVEEDGCRRIRRPRRRLYLSSVNGPPSSTPRRRRACRFVRSPHGPSGLFSSAQVIELMAVLERVLKSAAA
jgi:hypothetical protein